jgi:hypothetical protein
VEKEEHTRYCPFTLLDHGVYSLNNARVGFANVLGSQLVERPCLLNVGKSSLQFLQLNVNLLLGFLGFGNLFYRERENYFVKPRMDENG